MFHSNHCHSLSSLQKTCFLDKNWEIQSTWTDLAYYKVESAISHVSIKLKSKVMQSFPDLILFQAFSHLIMILCKIKRNICAILMQLMLDKNLISRLVGTGNYILTMEIFYKDNLKMVGVKEKEGGSNLMGATTKETLKIM